MRYIVFFLLFCNVAYFSWNFSQLGRNPAADIAAEPGIGRALLNTGLMLSSEYSLQVQQQRLENEENAKLCTQIGSFISIDDANSFITSAIDGGFTAELKLGGQIPVSQYRVYLPPFSSRFLATATLDRLSKAIAEAQLEIETYIITRGLLENAIALGVFARLLDSESVRNQISVLGYSAEIEEIPQSTGVIEVQLRALDSLQMDNPTWLNLAAGRPYLSYTENLCETIAQGPQFP